MLVNNPSRKNPSFETTSISVASMSMVTGSSWPETSTIVFVVNELTGYLGSSITVLGFVLHCPLAALGALIVTNVVRYHAHNAATKIVDRDIRTSAPEHFHVKYQD